MERKRFKILVESLTLSILFVLFGFVWNNDDPLFLNIGGNITYYIFVIILLTLYYGLLSGIVSMFVFGISAFFCMSSFPTRHFSGIYL